MSTVTRDAFVLEIREPGRRPRASTVDRALEVGRECDGIVVDDQGASRRHLKLLPSPLGLSVVDLDSRNGTLLNGVPLRGRTTLKRGDVVRLGRTEIVVVGEPEARVPVEGSPPPASHQSWTFPEPPPAPAPVERPGRMRVLLRRVFTGAPRLDGPLFRTYLELPDRVPLRVWQGIRVGSITAYVLLVVAMFVFPQPALFAFFSVIVPLLPILFFVAPGVWRNICPLAASNQLPRVLGFSRAATPPGWLRRRAFVIATALFFGIAGARLVLFNANATATGVLLGLTIVNAFAAGVVFKGKSGWCSSICPLLPLQRTYGQTPFLVVPNSHCRPCVACTKNCYDFKPQPAYQMDLHDPDRSWSAPRQLFVAILPGFVLGFFTLVGQPAASGWQTYAELALYAGVSVAGYFVLDAVSGLSVGLLAALYAATALNVFYWFAGVILSGSVHTLTGLSVPWLRWPISVLVAGLSVVWISRTYWTERRVLADAAPPSDARVLIPLTPLPPPPAAVGVGAAPAAPGSEVRFLPDDKAVAAETGTSLLDAAERAGLSIEAGCRMGVCGADPVAVLAGAECLSPIEEEEQTTLRRLGLAPSTRMACSARLTGGGSVQVNLTPEPGSAPGSERPLDYDRSITSVVVVGNGIAGVSAADFVRRGHPDCEIHLVGSESHVLYNRMGISRLVHGRSAMTGLFLLAEDWYAEKGVTAWLNTIATEIDPETRRVRLGTGEVLSYDRLILATGSSGAAPPIAGFGAPGSFVLRSAEDAMDIRRYAQQFAATDAVVSGGGLLGLEAAYALNELGLRTSVLERGSRLLSKQLDERGSALLHAHVTRLGIEVVHRAEASRLLTGSSDGPEAVTAVVTTDGRELGCQLFLACVGIRPNTELAAAAGIPTRRGVLVDDRMATALPGVYAAGDVAEHGGSVLGLWPIAAKQGETAALNALGGAAELSAEVPVTVLKGVGLELSSVGVVSPEPQDEVIVSEDVRYGTYRRLVLRGLEVVGAIVIGRLPEDLAAATAAVKKRRTLDPDRVAALRAGDWSVLR